MSDKVSVKSNVSRDEVIGYLESLISALRNGTISVEGGGGQVTFDPPKRVDLEVEAARKGEKSKIAFSLAWRPEPEADGTPVLVISDKAPEPKPESKHAADKSHPEDADESKKSKKKDKQREEEPAGV